MLTYDLQYNVNIFTYMYMLKLIEIFFLQTMKHVYMPCNIKLYRQKHQGTCTCRS